MELVVLAVLALALVGASAAVATLGVKLGSERAAGALHVAELNHRLDEMERSKQSAEAQLQLTMRELADTKKRTEAQLAVLRADIKEKLEDEKHSQNPGAVRDHLRGLFSKAALRTTPNRDLALPPPADDPTT